MKIYTRKGDTGTTSLKDNVRVDKNDVRIEANGAIDELNAMLGMVRASLENTQDKQQIELIQNVLMRIMGIIAGGKMDENYNLATITADLEKYIDEHKIDGKFCFVVPGETMQNAYIHYARTKTRTAERRMWEMNKLYPISDTIMQFINRLSDYLFVLSAQ